MAFIDQFERRQDRIYYRPSGKGPEYQVTEQQLRHWQERAHEATMVSLVLITLGLLTLFGFMGMIEHELVRLGGIPMVIASWWPIRRAWNLPLRDLANTAPVAQELRPEEVRDRFWKARPVHFWLALPLTILGYKLLIFIIHMRSESQAYVLLGVVLTIIGFSFVMIWQRARWKSDRRSNLGE